MSRSTDIDQTIRTLIERLRLPSEDRSFAALIAAIEASYGKPILVKPLSRPDRSETGYWVDYEGHGTILYREWDTESVQHQTVLHECMHIIAGHSGCSARPESAAPVADAHGAFRSLRARSLADTDLSFAVREEERIAEHGAFQLARWLRGADLSAADIF